MQVIIYNQENGMPAVMTPMPNILSERTILEVAIKDVPAGKPFKIVDVSELPQDIPQEYWLVDDSELTDGIGGESNEFTDEQPLALHQEGVNNNEPN